MYNYWLLLATSTQLLAIQFVSMNNLIAGHAQSLKKAWSLFKSMVWAEFKMLAGMVLIISFGPCSCTGKTCYELCIEYRGVANMEKIKDLVLHVSGENCW